MAPKSAGQGQSPTRDMVLRCLFEASPMADEETRRQLEEYLASLLLPGSAEPR